MCVLSTQRTPNHTTPQHNTRHRILLSELLQDAAAAAGAQLSVAPPLSSMRLAEPGGTIHVGLAGDHQTLNASLAVALTRCWEQRHLERAAGKAGEQSLQQQQQRLGLLAKGVLPPAYAEGLQSAAWPGRSQASSMQPLRAHTHTAQRNTALGLSSMCSCAYSAY